MKPKINYFIKLCFAILLLNLTPYYCYAISIADKISISPFFSFSAPFTQLKKVEYNAQYSLAELTSDSTEGGDGGDIMPPPIAKTTSSFNASGITTINAIKDFNPYGYKAGLLFNNFLAISYGFKTASSAKNSSLQDSSTNREFFYEIDRKKHGFTSHSLNLALIKQLNDKTSFYISSGLNKEDYESSYRVFNSTTSTNYKYNLDGTAFNFGVGTNILIRPANYINVLTKIQTGNLKGKINTTVNSATLENPIKYQGNIETSSFTSYSVEVNYIINLESSPNIERAIEKIL